MSAGSVDDNSNSDSFMKSVRFIQDAFYSSSDTKDGQRSGHPFLDGTTGVMHNLPILMSPSTELPGRQTVRFIDDPLEINMLESLLRRCSEENAKGDTSHCYVGQLYRDPTNNTRDVNNPLNRPKIRSWRDFTHDDAGDCNEETCVGTMLQIMDFRRVPDGRMVLLVQGVERFAISKVYQELPYIIVDAQILPDEEELSDHPSISSAVVAAFAWHSFEYDDNVVLADDGSAGEEMSIEIIVGEHLSKLIPFAPFNSEMTEENLCSLQESIAQDCSSNVHSETTGHQLPSIQDFTSRTVLSNVPTFTNLLGQSDTQALPRSESIEYDLWLCIDEYVRLRSLQDLISPDLISLLPLYKDWPNDFCLEHIASNLRLDVDEAKVTGKTKKNIQTNRQIVRVGQSLHYPNERRMRRLSYSASALLGGSTPTDLLNKGVRQTLLEVPSTRGRLWAVLERFVEYNSQLRSTKQDD